MSGVAVLAGCLGTDSIEITFNGDSDDSGTDDDGDSDTDGGDETSPPEGEESGDGKDDDGGEDEGGPDRGDEADEDEDGEADGDEDDDPDPKFSEDCIGVDPSNLSIDEISGNRWRISSGNIGLLVFDEKDNATNAKDLIEFYGFTSICFVGRPDPPMTYWLSDGSAPSTSGSPGFSEDCIGIDPSNLSIDEISGNRWRISSGNIGLLVFDEEDNARRAMDIIEFYGFTSICFVGRPDPPMTYWTR